MNPGLGVCDQCDLGQDGQYFTLNNSSCNKTLNTNHLHKNRVIHRRVFHPASSTNGSILFSTKTRLYCLRDRDIRDRDIRVLPRSLRVSRAKFANHPPSHVTERASRDHFRLCSAMTTFDACLSTGK